MEMRRAWKPTELGAIPKDWNVIPISELHPFVTSGSRGWAKFYADSGSPFIRISNLSRESIYLNLDDLRFVSLPENDSEGARTKIRAGDVLVSITADIGIIGYVTGDMPDPSYINQHIALVRFDAARTSSLYVSYFLASKRPQKLFRALTDAGAKAGMNLRTVTNIRVAFPPARAEQQAIAEALNDADALIKSLEQLLAKKRQIKQGAMQELLTGKKRLPGFNGKWENKKLGTLGSFLKGSGVKKDQAMSGSLPCIRYGEIYTRHHDLAREFYSWLSPDVAATATRIRKGDLLFAGSGETKEEIGKCVAISADVEAYAGGDIVILRTQDNDEVFLGYYLNTAEITQQKASRGQGDAVVHISSAALADVDCCLPRPREQRAIGQALFDMDNELTALEAKLTKARQIKQGITQELLTGRIRLVSPNSALVSLSDYRQTKFTAGTAHNRQIEEAVMLGVLSLLFGTEQYPLARVRRTKLLYLLQCYLDQPTDAYLKKAAGPYNPGTRYKGPEGIAVRNGYVRIHHNGAYEGFVAGDKASHARAYFEKWHGAEAFSWLERLRFKKTEELELLATVHMAAQELRKQGKVVEVNTVCRLIASEPEWLPKLDRALFSKGSIAAAIVESRVLFGE